MPDATETRAKPRHVLPDAEGGDAFAAIADPENGEGREILRRIADKIGRTRRPGEFSEIPAGATYLAQFATHDLDLRGRDDLRGGPRLDLALIYGDGPRHDAFAYQVPSGPGEPRSLLRVGRARPAWNSPAWGAARDLPRTSCPHLDARGSESRSEVLIPNGFSDSNLLLGQIQTVWALLHNAVVAKLGEVHADPADRFDAAVRITRHVYRQALINDVLGGWLHPALRDRYVRDTPDRLSKAPLTAMPRAYMAGVARLGHGLVREIYALNEHRQVEGLRSLVRHTSTSRPADMPLTEDWLVDFSRFFDFDAETPTAQRARRLGPHVPRPFALGGGVGLDAPTPNDGLVLRDLIACTRSDPATGGGVPKIRTLVARIRAVAPEMFTGFLARDEHHWREAVGAWLADLDLDPLVAGALAEDPPLTLFLMLEAEADAGGMTLGVLGSILMGETLAGALPAPAPRDELEVARDAVFKGPVPACMRDLVLFLQRHYRFVPGARLHPAEFDRKNSTAPSPTKPSEASMLDDQSSTKRPAGLVEVADYIELGRLVADWTRDPEARPKDIDELVAQLDGIAKVPENFRDVQFVEGRKDVLVIRLPERELTASTMSAMENLLVGDRYMLPKFYDDIYHKHFGPVMTPLDTFLARIGDYTIAQCQ